MALQLLIDDRERAIVDEISKIGGQWWRTQRLTHGDYALTFSNGFDLPAHRDNAQSKTIMIIERKTYSDFAQSIKDNRIFNLGNLVAIRNEYPAIDLAILIEGTRPRSESEQVAGIPYKSIRAKINHLRIRDKFHVFETADARDTALCLRGLVVDTISLYKKQPTRVVVQPLTSANVQSLGAAPEGAIARLKIDALEQPNPPPESQDEPSAPPIPTTPALAPPSAVVRPLPELPGTSTHHQLESQSCVVSRRANQRTIVEEVRRMYEMFPGVGPKIADTIIRAGVSINTFVRGPAQSQRTIARLAMRYARERNEAMDCSILARISQVSPPIATEILHFTNGQPHASATLSFICSLTRKQLITFRYKNRSQIKICSRIFDCLHYGDPPMPL